MKQLIFAIRCFFHAMKSLKGGEDMRFAFYVAYAIMQGTMKWNDVPANWQPAVKYWLDLYGVNTDGQPIVPENVPTAE